MDDIIIDVSGTIGSAASAVEGWIVGNLQSIASFLWSEALKILSAIGAFALAEFQRLGAAAANRSPFHGRPIHLDSLIIGTIYEVFADAYGA